MFGAVQPGPIYRAVGQRLRVPNLLGVVAWEVDVPDRLCVDLAILPCYIELQGLFHPFRIEVCTQGYEAVHLIHQTRVEGCRGNCVLDCVGVIECPQVDQGDYILVYC